VLFVVPGAGAVVAFTYVAATDDPDGLRLIERGRLTRREASKGAVR